MFQIFYHNSLYLAIGEIFGQNTTITTYISYCCAAYYYDLAVLLLGVLGAREGCDK